MGSSTLVITCIYWPPGACTDAFCDKFFKLVEYLASVSPNFMICGDFNFHIDITSTDSQKIAANKLKRNPDKTELIIMSTPLGGGYIIFAFSAVRCPMSGVRRPMSGVTHGFRSFKGKVLELLSPNLVCRLIGSVACLGLLLAVVPLLLTE